MRDAPRRQLTEREQHESARTLRTGLALSELDVDQLWASCIALDGAVPDPRELEQMLRHERDLPLTAHEHDVLAQAFNDHFTARGEDHPVPYADELHPRPPHA